MKIGILEGQHTTSSPAKRHADETDAEESADASRPAKVARCTNGVFDKGGAGEKRRESVRFNDDVLIIELEDRLSEDEPIPTQPTTEVLTDVFLEWDE